MRIDAASRQANPPVIHSGRNEFQVFLMLLSIMSGVILVFIGNTNDPQGRLIPGWIQAAWGFGLIISAAINLFANFFPWKDEQNGKVLELVSCIGLVIVPLVYTFALLGFLDHQDASQFLALDFLALVAGLRAVRLFRYIRQIDNLRRIESNLNQIAQDLKKEEK